MKSKIHYQKLFLLWIISIFMFIGMSSQDSPSIAEEPWGILVEREEDTGGLTQCRFCEKTLKKGNIHMDAEKIIKSHLKNNLLDMGISFIDEKGQGRYIHVLIYRFTERRGGNLAVEKPASVGFHIHLFDRDGILKKVYVFDETQQALSENVLSIGKFLRRRARWITAGELAEEGIYNGLTALKEDLK